jgi:serine/threonine protein kinase
MGCQAVLVHGTRLRAGLRDYHYETGTVISKDGNFGDVYEALKSTGEQCAIKIFKGIIDLKPVYEHEKAVLAELRRCSSPYLAKCDDYFQDQTSSRYCIIMPRWAVSVCLYLL